EKTQRVSSGVATREEEGEPGDQQRIERKEVGAPLREISVPGDLQVPMRVPLVPAHVPAVPPVGGQNDSEERKGDERDPGSEPDSGGVPQKRLMRQRDRHGAQPGCAIADSTRNGPWLLTSV